MTIEARKYRAAIAAKVRELRRERHWTQAELAKVLGLSQNRLSEIEGGEGSFSAEQLLLIMRTFNVAADFFAPVKQDASAQLQNAIARLGGGHLREREVVPTRRWDAPEDVVRETLIAAPSPRHIAALAPLVVRQLAVENLSLSKARAELAQAGYERRLGWLLENVQKALEHELKKKGLIPLVEKDYQRAATVLRLFLAPWRASLKAKDIPDDVLDPDVTSERTVAEIRASASDVSRGWRILTRIDVSDFALALRQARGD